MNEPLTLHALTRRRVCEVEMRENGQAPLAQDHGTADDLLPTDDQIEWQDSLWCVS